MPTKSFGFSLIELLVVVAILGILSTVGIVAYQGYVTSARVKSTENAMVQISLGQTEWFSDNSIYFESTGAASNSCDPTSATSDEIEDELLGEADTIKAELGFEICSAIDGAGFVVIALKVNPDGTTVTGSQACQIEMDQNMEFTRTGTGCS